MATNATVESAFWFINANTPYAGEVIFTLIGALEPKRPKVRILTSNLVPLDG